jgi:hypothetical protein
MTCQPCLYAPLVDAHGEMLDHRTNLRSSVERMFGDVGRAVFDDPEHITIAIVGCELIAVGRQATEPLYGTAKSLDDAPLELRHDVDWLLRRHASRAKGVGSAPSGDFADSVRYVPDPSHVRILASRTP